MVVTIKLLHNNKLSNNMENKYFILKNYLLKIIEDVAVGTFRNRNFGM